MIIKTDLIWLLESGKRVGIFTGFYDMVENWSDISTIYLSHPQLVELVRVVSKLPSLPLRIYKDDLYTTISADGINTKLDIHTVWVAEGWHSLYAIPTKLFPKSKWVNWERMDDTTRYSWAELYQAVVAGVKAGLSKSADQDSPTNAGFPEEWAWTFTVKDQTLSIFHKG